MNLQKIYDFDISIISDPHVLAYDLIADTEDFRKEIKIDRKLLVESEGLFKQALDMVDRAGSKFLFLPGDMVKDGEYISQEVVVKYLKEWKAKDPDRELFITPGNHDINAHRAYDFKKDDVTKNVTPAEFYDLYDFIFENPYVLEMYKDSDIFHTYLDEVNKIYNRSYEYSYYAHGYLSYVARIPSKLTDNGLTIISLDTSIYSADTEQSHRDGRENVAGSVTLAQMRWVVDKIDEAKKRKDLIFVMAHHALMPNFRNQELVFSPFIIKEWRSKFSCDDERIDGKTPIEVLADNGVKFVFTGHLHENGTAKYTSGIGNITYDVQTGSTVTYPLPIRHIKINNAIDSKQGFDVFIKTELIKDFSFVNLEGELVKIDDAINYTIGKQLSLKDVLHNYIRIQANNPRFQDLDLKAEINRIGRLKLGKQFPEKNYVNDLIFPEIVDLFPINKKYGRVDVRKIDGEYEFVIKGLWNTLSIKASNLEAAIEIILEQVESNILIPMVVVKHWDDITNKAWEMPIDDDGHTFYDFANYIYQYKPLGEEERPSYVTTMIENLNNPDYNIIEILLDYLSDEINEAFDKFTSSIEFEKDGSKKKFFDDLVQTRGLISSLAYRHMRRKVHTLRDLLDFFSIFITKKRELTGVDFAKTLIRTRMARKFKEDFSDKMFGQTSLRAFVIGVVNSISDEMVEIYQNEDLNEVEQYFNFIEYSDVNN